LDRLPHLAVSMTEPVSGADSVFEVGRLGIEICGGGMGFELDLRLENIEAGVDVVTLMLTPSQLDRSSSSDLAENAVRFSHLHPPDTAIDSLW